MSRPSSIIQVTSLPLSDIQYPNDKEDVKNAYGETFGRILFDTKYVWVSNGSNFMIVNSKTGCKIAAWTFGSIIKDYSTKIVCVEELPRCNAKFPLLVIGLECDSSKGCVCIFDVTESRVLRAIQIEDKVTSLHVINTNQDGCPLPGPLRAFDGILGIGTAGGNVLVLDLCKQIYEEILTGSGTDIRDEINNCEMKIVLPENVASLELFKRAAIKNGEHLSVHLNATFNKNVPHFILKGPKGDDRIYVNKLEVTVSALHYCSQLGSLLVGYNFGAWQLWNLMTLKLVHTSAIYKNNIPVTHFAIQEPSDDPRAFCYVWAVYSNTMKYQTGSPVAILNSLNFGAKEWHEGYGILYQDLQSCTTRFQTNLTLFDDTASSEVSHGGYCLRLQTINQVISKGNLGHEQQDETLSICAFIWNEWKSKSSAISVHKTYLRLFDLNQWYKEQMPNSSHHKENDNYMSNICLNNFMDDVNSDQIPFLDILINPNSLSQFIGVQKLEEHYYPSSLAFELCSLREKDVICFNNQGSQRSLLAQLELGGPLSLIKPTQLYQQCVDVGLLPLFTEAHLDLSTTYEFQREVLLSIALEQQLIGWLCRCATAWSNGSYSASGSTLQLLLNWGWRRALVLKQQANSLSIPLFNYSGLRLDSNTHNLLSSCAKQLTSLTTLFEFIFKKFATQLMNKSIIKHQLESLQMVSVHLEVLQWLLNVGLLPECPFSSYPHEDECNRVSAPYPINSLLDYYGERRSKLQSLANEQFSSSESLLFIDNLVKLECGGVNLEMQWENDGGTGAYPPPSLQALLRTYLVEGVDISMKHCLVVYVFLDLAMTLDKSRYNAITTHLIKFPAVFQLSPSIIKITQAFWQLDHGDFATAMDQLLDSLVCVKDIKVWQHRIALRALLAQNQHKYALLYLQVRKPPVNEVNDMCVVLSLYVANFMLEEAFHFQRRNKCKEFEIKLLRHFYRECDKIGKITSVVYFPLNKTEENIFMNYLHEHKHPKLENLQTFFYVRNSRFLDAYNANQKFNSLKGNQQGLDGMSNNSVADIMVKGFINTLPEVSKNLIDVYHKDKNLLKEVKQPEPFSVYIHTAKNDPNYKSSLIQTIITKTKEIWTHPALDNASESNEFECMSNSSNFEDVPFLRTLRVDSLLSRPATPLIFPNIITCSKEVTKEEIYEPTPPKRFKPCPQSSLRKSSLSTLTDPSFSDDNTTLVTPIIKRKTCDKGGSSDVVCDLFSVKTPQSILKMHNPPEKPAKVNFATPTVIKATFSEEVTPVPTAKTKWNVTSRRSIGHTPRPAVRFNISQDSSDSSSDETNELQTKTVQEVAVIHEPKIRNSSESLKASNSSLSTDSFYSPNSSVKSEANLSMQMDVDTSPKKQATLKRPMSTNTDAMNDEIPTASPAKRPRSRSSYKTSTSLSSVSSEEKLISNATSSYQTASQSSVGTDISSTCISFPSFLESDNNLSQISDDPITSKSSSGQSTSESSSAKTKLKGRRTLTRKVLENNAFVSLAKSVSSTSLPEIEATNLKTDSDTQDDTTNLPLSYIPPKCRKSLTRGLTDDFPCSSPLQKSLYTLPPLPTLLLEPDFNASQSTVTTKEVKTVVTTHFNNFIKEHTEEIVSSTSKVEVEENYSRYSPDLPSNVLSVPSPMETNEDENLEESEKNSEINEEEDINIYENVSNHQQVDDCEINNDVNLNNYADVFDDDNEIITNKNKNDVVAEVVVLDDEEDKFSESSHSVSSNLQGEVIELDDSSANESDSSSYESYDEDVMQETDDSNSKSTFDRYSIDDSTNKSDQFARIDDVISLDVIPEEPELKILEDNQQSQIVEVPEIDNILVETVKTTSSSSSVKSDDNISKNCDDETPMEEVENPSDDLILKENSEKVVTPARRSKRLSSLQLSTPNQTSLPKRTVRKSLSIAGDTLTPKTNTSRTNTPRTRKANSSNGGTPISTRRRSTSIDLKEPEKHIVVHKNGSNIQESLVTPTGDLEVSKLPITRKRSTRANSETPTASTSAIEAYSATRRLTRRQASLLEKSLSVTSISEDILHPEENVESESEESDIQERGPEIGEIDPIKLLDKSNFTGNPDPDEENIHNSPPTSLPGSPVGSVVTRRTRKQRTLSNSSRASDLSTSSTLKKSSAKKSTKAPQRKQYRSKSLDVKLIDVSAVENTPSPKRKTRQTSKEELTDIVVTERKKVVPIRRTRASSLTLDQNVPVRRSERRMQLTKPDLTEITEEQSAVENQVKGKKANKR